LMHEEVIINHWSVIFLIFLQLANTEEYIDGSCTGNLGEVLVRCNNVLYIRGVEEDDEEGEMRD
jgi:small nuclear ribonucleoprotein F